MHSATAADAKHLCSQCGIQFELNPLPTIGQRLSSQSQHIGFGEYVYATCPACGKRDWATERSFLGFLGPKGFYALALILVCAFVGVVVAIALAR